MSLHTTRRILFAGAALVTLSGQAFALDGADLLKKINAAYNVQGAEIGASSIDVDGTTVTFKGLTFKANTAAAAQTIPLGSVTMEGVEQDEDGSYYIETAKFPDIDFSDNKLAIKVSDMYISGMHVPADTTTGDVNSLFFYEEAHSGPILVSVDGKEVASVKESTATMDLSDDENEISFNFIADGLKADLSDVTDPQAKDAIDKLQLQKISGKIAMEGTWEIQTGTIDMPEYSIEVDNVGKLNLALGFSGYTLQFIKSMQETVKAAAENPNQEQANQAAGLAMLGLAQQLSFINAEISFKDAGITRRGLDYAAGQQGMTAAQLADTIKGMAPLMLAQLNLPELQNSVSEAINKYIDKPGNFTISAKPASPVPFPMIAGAAMGAPNTLPTVLGVKVTAND